MEKLNYMTQKWLEEIENVDMNTRDQLLTNVNEISPIIIKCASLNNCLFQTNGNSSTDVENDKIPRAFSNKNLMTERKTKSDIEMIETSMKLKLDNIEIDSQSIDETQTLEEKAFQFFKVAQQNFDQNKYDDALIFYNKAITCYTISPLIYAKRAQTFLKLNKPMNCINDCSSALAIAPDHVLARKFRGRAYMLMGEWDKAMSDLVVIDDDDEEVNEWMDKILPMVNKRNVHESEDDKVSQLDNIEGGDNFILNELEIEEEMQDPEIIEALEKCPKIKKLFKKLLKMIKGNDYVMDHKEGDTGFSYFTSEPRVSHSNEPKNVDNQLNFKDTNLDENDQWLQNLKKQIQFHNITEEEGRLYDRNIFQESETMYPTQKSSVVVDDLSD